MSDRHIHGSGTPETEWLACEELTTLPAVAVEALVPENVRLVICAPHPDDEILPCAGLLAAAHEIGRSVEILALTDGEGSHGNHPKFTRERLRHTRPRETEEAIRRLGVRPEIQRLGLPDGNLADAEGVLSLEFSRRFRRGDVVIAPWRWDGHPDHEAAARAARAAAARVGASVWETPIWGWHWSNPSTAPMPWERGRRFVLTDAQIRRKAFAIRAFESQLALDEVSPPILPDTTLERFARPWEVYFA